MYFIQSLKLLWNPSYSMKWHNSFIHVNDNSNLSISRGRRLTNCYMNQAQAMPLFVITCKRYTQEVMETLKNSRCKDYILLCLEGNVLVCLVPMVQAKPLLSTWSVYRFFVSSNEINFWEFVYAFSYWREQIENAFNGASFEAFTFTSS